jgi:hypothetical protein
MKYIRSLIEFIQDVRVAIIQARIKHSSIGR